MELPIMESCPLCGSRIEDDYNATPLLGGTDIYEINCPVCKKYNITAEAELGLQSHEFSQTDKHLLSGCARERFEIHKKNPSTKSILSIKSNDILSLLDLAPKRVHEKAMKLFAAIERRTSEFGQSIQLENSTDYSLAYAQSPNEFKAFRNYLHERGFLEFKKSSMHGGGPITLLADGFAELEKRQQSNLESQQAFVALSFEDEILTVYENQIAPGIHKAGYKPVCMKFEEHNNDSATEILAEIRQSRFLVADFTGQRQAVYFEAGFAMGLSLPIIWMVREDDMKKCAFNTEHFNHITWKPGDSDLKNRVTNRIRATIGQGPLKPDRK